MSKIITKEHVEHMKDDYMSIPLDDIVRTHSETLRRKAKRMLIPFEIIVIAAIVYFTSHIMAGSPLVIQLLIATVMFFSTNIIFILICKIFMHEASCHGITAVLVSFDSESILLNKTRYTTSYDMIVERYLKQEKDKERIELIKRA